MCVFVLCDSGRAGAASGGRLGALSPGTRGEASQGVQALTGTPQPLPPRRPRPSQPALLSPAGHSRREPLRPGPDGKRNRKFPAPATGPSSGHWGSAGRTQVQVLTIPLPVHVTSDQFSNPTKSKCPHVDGGVCTVGSWGVLPKTLRARRLAGLRPQQVPRKVHHYGDFHHQDCWHDHLPVSC